MHYYIHTAHSGWHEVNRKYYREFIDCLRMVAKDSATAETMIAEHTRKSEIPLDINELMNGG